MTVTHRMKGSVSGASVVNRKGPTKQRSWTMYDVPDDGTLSDESMLLARASLDFLAGCEGLFSEMGGWKANFPDIGVNERFDVLVQLLRREEPLPAIVRSALADALDPSSAAPITMVFKTRGKRAKLKTSQDWVQRVPVVLKAYEAALEKLKSSTRPTNHSNRHELALAEAARAAGTNESDANRMLADAREQRDRQARDKAASFSGKYTVAELNELFRTPLPRRRGPRSKKRDNCADN